MSRLIIPSMVAVTLIACVPGGDADEPVDPLTHPELLTPVAQATAVGVTPYWVGEQFISDNLIFHLLARVELVERGESPGIEFSYGADVVGGGAVTFNVESHLKRGGGADFFRDQALKIPGTVIEHVRVGQWEAELYAIPAAVRPINNLWLFVEVGDSTVIGQAASGETGVPGTDPNPLIDKDLLISVMAEHLRPYPE